MYDRAEPALRFAAWALRWLPRPLCAFFFTLARHVPTLLGVALRYVLVARLAKRCGRCVAIFEGVHLRGLATTEIGDHVSVHPMSYIDGSGGLRIGDDVSIAHAATVLTTEHDFRVAHQATRDAAVIARPLTIGDDVWIGCGARVLGGSSLADHSVVGAGSVVTKSSRDGEVIAGVPARVLRRTTKSLRPKPNRRLTYVVTSDTSTRLLRGQLSRFAEAGFNVELIASPGDRLEAFCEHEGVRAVGVPIKRRIAPLADLVSLWRLYRHFRQTCPDIVNASTPKAGLLGMIAARMAGVSARVYVLRGLRLETTTGLRRRLLAATEWLAARCAHRVVSVSDSLREIYVGLGLSQAEKVVVVGSGSSNGIDVAKTGLRDSIEAERERSELRDRLGFQSAAIVYGVVGRLTRDKGLADLMRAFHATCDSGIDARLLIVGDNESGDSLTDELVLAIDDDPRVHKTGFVSDPETYLRAMDVLLHPSLREGFPNAVLEAAAAGLPTIGRRVTGVVDSVVDDATGILVEPNGSEPLRIAMTRYGQNLELAREHGRAARARVEQRFAQPVVWDGLERLYDELCPPRGSVQSVPQALARQAA